MDSILGGFSEGLIGFTKRPLYDDHYVGTYTKIESNLCFLSVCVIVKNAWATSVFYYLPVSTIVTSLMTVLLFLFFLYYFCLE